MPRIERNFEQTLKNLKRDVVELKRTSQASLVGYVDKETGKIKDTIDNLTVDLRTPAAPVEVVAGSFVLETYNGKRRDGYVTLSSAAVVNDVDAMPIDIAKYELWMIPATAEEGDTYTLQSSAVEPNLRSLPVEVGKTYLAKMRAISTTGTAGLFSEVQTVTVTEDTTPPPVPSSLVLGQRLGVIEATWDGLSFGGTVMPLDFWRTEIGYRSGAETDYTISTEWFEEGGIKYITGLPYNQMIYVSHRAYDYAGNVSDWTQPATITVQPVVDEDSIKQRLDEVQGVIDAVGAELDQTRLELANRLDQAEIDLADNDQKINQLITVDLPQLNTDLDANADAINNLETVTIPGINSRLGDAEADLATAKTELDGRLDQAEADITTAESNLTTLNNVTIPNINTQLSDAQADIDSNNTALNARLDDAFVDIGTAQSTADGAVSAASDAQIAADEAQTYAETQVALLIAQGANLVRNGDFEQGLEGWAQSSFITSDTTVARSGSKSMKLGPNPGGNLWPTSEFVPSSSGRTFYLEYWMRRSGSEDNPIGVGFVVQSKTASGGYSTPITGRVDSLTISETGWTKVSVTFTPGTDDVVAVRFAPWVTAGNNAYYVDDFLAVDVTEAKAALDAAADAQADANAAQTAAGTAQDTADSALSMAGTKSIVYYSTSAPSGTGVNVNDVWRRVDSSKNVIGEWYWTGSAWQSSKITSESIANLDVGKLSVSSAAISEAVIEKLWAEVITAKKILTDQLLVGNGENLIVDSWFESTDIKGFRSANADLTGGWGRNSVANLNWYGGSGQPTDRSKNFFFTAIYDRANPHGMIPIVEGAKYKLEIPLYNSGSQGGARPTAYVVKKDGTTTYTASNFITNGVNTSGYQAPGNGLSMEAVWEPPADYAYFIPAIQWENSCDYAHIYGGVSLRNMADGSLIVSGSITGDHLEVNSVAAKVATVMKLDVGSLTASSATISSSVIEKLWAEVITAKKITTEMMVVGQGSNMVPWNVLSSDPQNWQNLAPYGTASSYDYFSYQSVGGLGDGPHLYLVSDLVSPGVDTNVIQIGSRDFTLPNGSSGFPVEPGEQYEASIYVRAGGSYTTYPDTRLGLYFYNDAGSLVQADITPPVDLTWSWYKHRISGVAPADARKAMIYVRQDQPGGLRIDAPAFHKKVDGGLIVTGSITGDHLEVNSVATKVATVIELNASTITSGTINTARLNTTEIAAATATIQKVNASNIVATSATFSSAVIDKLWAEVITARKISADQVLIGSGLNVLPNAGFTNEAWPGYGRNTSNGPDGQPSIWLLGQKTVESPKFKVEGGKKYKFKIAAMANKDSNFYVQIRTTDGASNPYLVNNKRLNLLNTWLHSEGEFTMPAGTTEAAFTIYANHPNGTYQDGYQWFTDIGLYQMTDASLIVDGAVLAKHITASEAMSAKLGEFLVVKAGQLAANAVTAGTIDAGAVDGVMITGSVLRTSSSSSRVQMDSNGIHAWQSGVKKFYLSASTGEISAVGDIATGVDTTYRAKLSNRNGMAALDLYTAGGASAFHGALIAWDSDIALRRYTNETAFNGELAMTGTSIFFRNSYGGLQFTSGEGKFENSYGDLIISSTFARFGKVNDGYLQFTSTGTKLTDRNLATLIEDGTLSSTKTMFMPLISAVTTTGSANVNCNNGWTREVSSASRYKLAVQTMDESLDDKILSIEAKTWIDKSNSEIASEMMVPVRPGEERPEPPAGLLDRQPGVIAEEVLEAGLEEFVIFNKDGEIQSVMYDRLGVALIPVVKRLRDRVFSLEERLDAAGL